MSWLARSIPNSLLLDEEAEYMNRRPDLHNIELVNAGITHNHDPLLEQGRGVKEDLSELTETLTRQFWGVASFLAPPPPSPPPLSTFRKDVGGIGGEDEDEDEDEDEEEEGSRSNSHHSKLGDQEEEDSRTNTDHSDLGDQEEEDSRTNTDHSNLGDQEEEDSRTNTDHSNLGDQEEEDLRTTNDHSNLGDQEEEDLATCYNNTDGDEEKVEEEEAIGVTEEALAFAQNIGHHPETWLDFPLEEEEEEGFEDFHISDSQYKHALAIQRLVPTLAALKIELCPVHMSEGYFWMVYFVLLHSRLNKNDADQLSSSELVQARSMWREELQKRAKLQTDWFDRSTFHLQDSTLSPTISAREERDPELMEDSHTRHLSFNPYNSGSRHYHEPTYNEIEKQIVEFDKAKSAETPSGHSEGDFLTSQSSQVLQDHDDEDDWVQETEELDGYSTTGIMVNEEDVSFSDLEEDSDWTLPVRSK